MAQEIMKDLNKTTKDIETMKTKNDISPIREDLETLREDAREMRDHARTLAQDLKVEGKRQLTRAEEKALEALEEAKERGKTQYSEVSAFVQENPGQSLAIAFVGGIIASMLFGSRR